MSEAKVVNLDWRKYIVRRPDVMMGKPTFVGTRNTVEHVLAELGRGMTEAELLQGHPRLVPDRIRAAREAAATRKAT